MSSPIKFNNISQDELIRLIDNNTAGPYNQCNVFAQSLGAELIALKSISMIDLKSKITAGLKSNLLPVNDNQVTRIANAIIGKKSQPTQQAHEQTPLHSQSDSNCVFM